MTLTPTTRSLTSVLLDALDDRQDLRLLVGAFGSSASSTSYCNVVIHGTEMRVPMLRGVIDTQGAVAYLLATKDFVLCIGSVAP